VSTSSAAELPRPFASPGNFEISPGLELSLFASEPDVVDPVALCFDEFGRAYVVEMRDYPYGFGPGRRPGGTVRLLEDSDGDGKADRSTVFATDLSFPTGITPWNGGVLVTSPPEILFLKDTDGDGRADLREIAVSGFRLGVTDSNVNGLRYALDNWIHGVNGGNGGNLASPKRPGSNLPLGDRDFRFRPDTGDIEATTHTGGGFGLVFDEWGRSFTTYNIDHLQQRVADVAPFTRHPGLPPVHTTHSISDHGDMARIYPISTAVTRPNHPEQAGHFSAAGGMGYLGHPGWPGDLPGSIFVCDVVGNLVHRDRLVPDGPIFRATRSPSEQTREFFASRDPSFRPVGLEPGPDGALYLIDMQREVIEHPDYIPKKLLEKQDIRAGENRGRIYRIAPKGWPRRRELPGNAASHELADFLNSPNPWTRLTAQRLLVSRQDRSAVPALLRLATHGQPATRLHALWSLEGLGALPDERVEAALKDTVAPLRWNALLLAAARPAKLSPILAKNLPALLQDPDAEVRFIAALVAPSLGEVPDDSWLAFLRRNAAWPWSRRACLSALGPGTVRLLDPLFDSMDFNASAPPPILDLAREFLEIAVGTATHQPAVLPFPTGFAQLPEPLRIAVLDGIAQGLKRRQEMPVADPRTMSQLRGIVEHQPSPALLGATLRVLRGLGLPPGPGESELLARSRQRALDTTLPEAERVALVHLLGLGDFTQTGSTLVELLESRHPPAVRQAALDVLRERREPAVGTRLVTAWPTLSPAVRPSVVNLLVYRHGFHEALVSALESGALQIGELNLDLEHRRELLRKASASIRGRAAKFVSDEEYSNRKATVDDWLARLPAQGLAAEGRPVFERLCAQCHVAGGLGFRVGPELTGQGHRSVEDLLSNILDPNMAMNPAFVAFTAELKDGESETGILVSEGTEAITLVQAGGRKVEIPRSRIRELRSSGRSLMPDGLEAGLTPSELRNVIAFLQSSSDTPPAGGPGGAK
jgi:putative membrane-bound dehydrogenase-like protein